MTPLKSIEKIGKFSSVIHGGHQFPTSLTTHLLSLLTLSIITEFRILSSVKKHKIYFYFYFLLCKSPTARARCFLRGNNTQVKEYPNNPSHKCDYFHVDSLTLLLLHKKGKERQRKSHLHLLPPKWHHPIRNLV